MIPFVPPAHWVQMPQRAVSARVVDNWVHVKPQESFSVMVMPFPGTAAMLAGTHSKIKVPGVTDLSDKPVTLCGNAARLVTRKTASSLMEQVTVTRDGYGYLLMYGHPQKTPADPAIAKTMREFCPGASGAVPPLTPPPGWTTHGTFATEGMWMGNAPMQMMMLMKGPHQEHLIDAAMSGVHVKNVPKGLVKMHTKRLSLCGLPAVETFMSMNDPGMPMKSAIVATQNAAASYVLVYMHPASVASDPAAEAALMTLCAAPPVQPSPSPSVTP